MTRPIITNLSHRRGAGNLSKFRFLLVPLFLAFLILPLMASEYANIEYLCCAWGPAMTLPSKPGEKAGFDDSQEEVYFLKQRGAFTRGFMGGDQGHGISIYLCKMRADGSDKEEIRELWRDPNYPIDTQGQSCWMDVNAPTKSIALSVTYAGSDLTGLWIMKLDGSNLRRIISPKQEDQGLRAVGDPSWTPDGQWIVFTDFVRGKRPRHSDIAMCDAAGERFKRLLVGTSELSFTQSEVSPDGKRIAYVAVGDTNGGVSLMNIDGSEAHRIPNPSSKRQRHGGLFPAWSPDGTKILYIGAGTEIIDAATGQRILSHDPALQGKRGTCGMAHWGKLGLVGVTPTGGILLTDADLQEAKWIGSNKTMECFGRADSCKW